MAIETVTDRVKKIVAEQLGIQAADIQNEYQFVNDLSCDSMDCIEIVMTFEDEFEREIPDTVAENIYTVQDAINYLEKP